MNETYTEHRTLSRRQVVTALLACAALASAVAGRLMSCTGCGFELRGMPLFAWGLLLYFALGFLSVMGVRPTLLGLISLPGVAVQAGLVRHMFVLGATCWTCLATAMALFAYSLACLIPHRRWRFAPPLVAAAGVAILPLWSDLLVETERLAVRPTWVWEADLRSPPEDATLLVIYGHDGCPYCRVFDRDYESRLGREFGANLVLRRIDSRKRHGIGRLPSFLIRSKDGSITLVRGLPPYRDLVARLGSTEKEP